nr:MAG TPA: aspartate carbamoyltransferase regulatory subunit [Herelleviridae sp.]
MHDFTLLFCLFACRCRFCEKIIFCFVNYYTRKLI